MVENPCFLRFKPIPIVKFDLDKKNMKYSVDKSQGCEILTSSAENGGFQSCLSFFNKQKARKEISMYSVQEADTKTTEETTTENKIPGLQVKCKNSSSGCPWIGEPCKVENHLSDNCGYQPVRCTFDKCWSVILRKDLQAHALNCGWRLVKCDHCASMTTSRKMEKHLTKCSGFPITCTNGCEMSIARREMSKHTDTIKGNCPMTEVPCKYLRFGCSAKVKRKRLGQHMSSAQANHLELMDKWIQAVEKENSDLKQKVQKKDQHISNQARQIAILKKALFANKISPQILDNQSCYLV